MKWYRFIERWTCISHGQARVPFHSPPFHVKSAPRVCVCVIFLSQIELTQKAIIVQIIISLLFHIFCYWFSFCVHSNFAILRYGYLRSMQTNGEKTISERCRARTVSYINGNTERSRWCVVGIYALVHSANIQYMVPMWQTDGYGGGG